MATVVHTSPLPAGLDLSRCRIVQWGPLTTANADGDWVALPMFPDRTVHVFGTFGVGATVNIEGSNEAGAPAGGAVLNDSRGEGNALAFLTAGGNDVKQCNEAPLKMRPVLSGGDGTTSLTVIIIAKG